MEALPDPTSENFPKGKLWFRSNIPGRLTLEGINLQFHENDTSTWTVTYADKTNSFRLSQFRSYLSSSLGKYCVVKHVVAQYDGQKLKWIATIIPRKQRGTSLWHYIVPCLEFNSSVQKTPDIQKEKPSSNKTRKQKFNITKVTPRDCIVIGSDEERYTLANLGEILPRKLFYNGSDVTRKVFGKSRLCNHFVSVMKDGLDKPLIWSKNKLQYSKFARQSGADQSKEAENPDVRPVLNKSPAQKAAIPFDYSKLEQNYRLSKLRDRNVFRTVLEWEAIKLFQQEQSRFTTKPLHMDPEIVNNIACNGLPVDESLSEIFHTHCSLVGIDKDELRSELCRIGNVFYKKQHPM